MAAPQRASPPSFPCRHRAATFVWEARGLVQQSGPKPNTHTHTSTLNDLSADADLWVCSVGGDPAHIRRKLDIIVGQGLPPLELLRSSKLAERESRQDSRLPGSLGSRAGPSAATPHSRVPEVTS